MITTTELLALPFEEVKAKIDSLTDLEREELAEVTLNWLIEKLRELILEEVT